MINTFTRSPLKAITGWFVTAILLMFAVGCTPEAPEVEEGGGLGEEEVEQEEEVEEGEGEGGEGE